MADHCRQWCAKHPPTRPEGARELVGAFSGPFALATGVARTASGLGKGQPMVAALVLPVSSLLLTGSQRRTSRSVSRSVGGAGPVVALCWSFRNVGAGCRALWTRASLEAARALLSTVSKSVEGKIAAAGGRGECRRRDSSSAGTVDRTSARSESRRERCRLASAGTAWLPTKARAFDPDERILSKLACAERRRASRNPETADIHQSSQDIVSPMPARADSRPVSTAFGR